MRDIALNISLDYKGEKLASIYWTQMNLLYYMNEVFNNYIDLMLAKISSESISKSNQMLIVNLSFVFIIPVIVFFGSVKILPKFKRRVENLNKFLGFIPFNYLSKSQPILRHITSLRRQQLSM